MDDHSTGGQGGEKTNSHHLPPGLPDAPGLAYAPGLPGASGFSDAPGLSGELGASHAADDTKFLFPGSWMGGAGGGYVQPSAPPPPSYDEAIYGSPPPVLPAYPAPQYEPPTGGWERVGLYPVSQLSINPPRPQQVVAVVGTRNGGGHRAPARQTFGRHMCLACCVFWLCGCCIGFAAFIVAISAYSAASNGHSARARRLGYVSCALSAAGIVIGIAMTIAICSRIVLQVS